MTASTHEDSAVVPANSRSVRGNRAIGQLLSVPLAALLAFVALLAALVHRLGAPSRTVHVRRRHLPRRGPPLFHPSI